MKFLLAAALLALMVPRCPVYACEAGLQDITSTVVGHARQVLDQVERLGWTELEGVPLEQVRQRMGKVQACLNPRHFNELIENRASATSFPDADGVKRTIRYNKSDRQGTPAEYAPYIDLHEVLGVVLPGTEDVEYGIVVRAKAILSGNVRADNREPKFAYLSKKDWLPAAVKPRWIADGGAANVGRGGSWREIQLKDLLNQKLTKWFAEPSWPKDLELASTQSYYIGARIRVGNFDVPYRVNDFGSADPARVRSARYELYLRQDVWDLVNTPAHADLRDGILTRIMKDITDQMMIDISRGWKHPVTEHLTSSFPCP